MFSLIISIISIALVAALAAATVYFGGAAFNKGSAGADASTFINAGQQVAGAYTLSAADGYSVGTVKELSDGTKSNGQIYLAQIPSYKGTALTTFDTTQTNYISLAGVSGQVCDEINKRSHGNSYDFAATKTAGITGLYGCVAGTDVNAVGQAFYKVK